jgi:uncharacterized protein YodC (DUF2158 family)
MNFSDGDAVRLRTGGPVMTIQGAVGDLLLCSWMDENGRVIRQTYSPRQLQHSDHSHLLAVRALKRLARRWSVRATF